MISPTTYEGDGVSPDKPDVHDAIADQSAGLFPGAFCKIIEDTLTGDPDHVLVMHADGAGTKSTVAYIQYRETGDPTVFRGIAQDSLVMNTDDLLCVGAGDNMVVSNTIGRNAHRIGGDALKALIDGYAGFAQNMAPYGIMMTLAGGETADLGDLTGTLVVDSTLVARMKRNAVINADNIRPGNVIVGLASFGQAAYEAAPNSGIGSNGFTLARHALLAHRYAEDYPETVSTTLSPDKVYQGPYELNDQLPGGDMEVGEALLSPTRTYLPVVRRVLEAHGNDVTGIIHSSGGGQTKCAKFGQRGIHYIKDNLFVPPPIFGAIEAAANVSRREMYRTFNMGSRLEIYCDPSAAEGVIAIAGGLGVGAQVIGRVEANPDGGNRVTISDDQGMYTY